MQVRNAVPSTSTSSSTSPFMSSSATRAPMTSTDASPIINTESSSSSSGIGGGAIAGIVIGVLAAMALAVLGTVLCMRRAKSKRAAGTQQEYPEAQGPPETQGPTVPFGPGQVYTGQHTHIPQSHRGDIPAGESYESHEIKRSRTPHELDGTSRKLELPA